MHKIFSQLNKKKFVKKNSCIAIAISLMWEIQCIIHKKTPDPSDVSVNIQIFLYYNIILIISHANKLNVLFTVILVGS